MGRPARAAGRAAAITCRRLPLYTAAGMNQRTMPWALIGAACLGSFAATSSGTTRAPFPDRDEPRPRRQRGAGRQPGVVYGDLVGRRLGDRRLAVGPDRPAGDAGRRPVRAGDHHARPVDGRQLPVGRGVGHARRRLRRHLHRRGLCRGLGARRGLPARPGARLGDDRPVAHAGGRRAAGRLHRLDDRLARLERLHGRAVARRVRSLCSSPSAAPARPAMARARHRCARPVEARDRAARTGIAERICYGLATIYFATFLQEIYGLSLAGLAAQARRRWRATRTGSRRWRRCRPESPPPGRPPRATAARPPRRRGGGLPCHC